VAGVMGLYVPPSIWRSGEQEIKFVGLEFIGEGFSVEGVNKGGFKMRQAEDETRRLVCAGAKAAPVPLRVPLQVQGRRGPERAPRPSASACPAPEAGAGEGGGSGGAARGQGRRGWLQAPGAPLVHRGQGGERAGGKPVRRCETRLPTLKHRAGATEPQGQVK